MKSLLFPLMLVAAITWSQFSNVNVKPVISTAALDSILVTDGSDTLVNLDTGTDFTAVVAGQAIQGAGIPFQARVESKITATDSIVITREGTATGTVTIQHGVFASTAYADLDALGFPFFLAANVGEINSLTLWDDAEQLTSVGLVLFKAKFTQTLDNSTLSVSDADAENYIAYVLLDSVKAFDANDILWAPVMPLAVDAKGVYGQLVSLTTPTFTAVDNVTLRVVFKPRE